MVLMPLPYLLLTKISPPSGGLRKRTLSVVRLVLKVTLFCYCAVKGCFFVFREYKLD